MPDEGGVGVGRGVAGVVMDRRMVGGGAGKLADSAAHHLLHITAYCTSPPTAHHRLLHITAHHRLLSRRVYTEDTLGVVSSSKW